MTKLSERLNRLTPSATLAMSQKSAEMKAQGIDVINLSVGEPDFNTPDHIKEAAKLAINDNWSRYSPVPGYVDLGLQASLQMTRKLGFWLKGGNLLNQTIQRVPFYAEKGIYFTIGATLSL